MHFLLLQYKGSRDRVFFSPGEGVKGPGREDVIVCPTYSLQYFAL